MSSDRVSDVGRVGQIGEEPAQEGMREVRATMHPYNLRSRPNRGQGRHALSRPALHSLLHSSLDDVLAKKLGGVDDGGEGMTADDVLVESGMDMGTGGHQLPHLLATPAVDRGVGAYAHIPGPTASYTAGTLPVPFHLMATVTPSPHQGPGVSAAPQPQP